MATRRFNLRNRGVFTASIEEQLLAVRAGTYIDHFALELSADLTAATTTAIETFLSLLNPFQFKVNGDVRFSLRGRDLYALNALYLGRTPGFFEGAAGEDDKVFGLRIPIWYTVAERDSISWLATRVAIVNVSGEDISVAYTTKEGVQRRGYYHIVELTGTSPATTGVARAVDFLPRVGILQGLLFFSTSIPTATADTITLDEIRLYRNDVLDVVATWQDLGAEPMFTGNLGTASAFVDILANYRWLDLGDDPWDLRADRVAVDIDFQVASEAFRIIPVYLVPAGGAAAAAR